MRRAKASIASGSSDMPTMCTVGGPLKLHDERSAAVFLGRSRRTLQAWRARKCGPAYYDAGGILYAEEDLLAWLRSRRHVPTSDSGSPTP